MSTPPSILTIVKDPDPAADLLVGFNWGRWLPTGDTVGNGEDTTTAPVWTIARADGAGDDGLLVLAVQFVEGASTIARLHCTDEDADDLDYLVRCRIKTNLSAEGPIRTLRVKVRKT